MSARFLVERSPRPRSGERGVALLMVVTAIALLTAVAVEFSYHAAASRRDWPPTRARDELRAYYLARSAVNIGRLVLHFQKQVDGIQLPDLSSLLGPLLGGARRGLPPG